MIMQSRAFVGKLPTDLSGHEIRLALERNGFVFVTRLEAT